MKLRLTTLVIAASWHCWAPVPPRKSRAAPNLLVAAKVATPPALDGNANDPAWAIGQAHHGQAGRRRQLPAARAQTTATLKAVYSGDMVYFLVQYNDPTESMRRGPFQKQADGSWKKLKDPDDKGGDDNVYYEDKWAMIWNIGNSIAAFDKKGCMAACHEGEAAQTLRQQVHLEGRRDWATCGT